jgi:hypothetical protein
MAEPPLDLQEGVGQDERGCIRERKFTLLGRPEGDYTSYFANGRTKGEIAGDMNGVNALSPDDTDGDLEDREKVGDDLLKDLQHFNKP